MTVANDRGRIAPHDPHNLFDRLSRESTLQVHYDHLIAREQRLIAARLPIPAGEVLSVTTPAAGRNPNSSKRIAPNKKSVDGLF